jgi:hypothetical protein
MEEQTNYFAEMAKIDVSYHMEKKGKFNYLSWAWAVDQLRRQDPTATWEVMRFNGMPFMKTECGYFVEVAVTSHGVTLSQIHPVLDNSNKPVLQPNAFQINTSIQRCLVKAIALHGLGLYIYAGEDLPDTGEGKDEQGKQDTTPPKITATIKSKWILLAGSEEGLQEWFGKKRAEGWGTQEMDHALTKRLEEKKLMETYGAEIVDESKGA